MIMVKGKCLKCGESFLNTRTNGISHKYEQVECLLEDGCRLCIGVCSSCTFDESDFEEALKTYNDWAVANKSVVFACKIKAVVERITYVELMLRLQGNKCPTCHKAIDPDGNYIVTGFPTQEVRHEGC